jgi:hypothetical protein
MPAGGLGGGVSLSAIILPTARSACTLHLLRALAVGRADALLAGPAGSGKSAALRELAASLRDEARARPPAAPPPKAGGARVDYGPRMTSQHRSPKARGG